MYIRSASSPSTALWAFHTIQPSSYLYHWNIRTFPRPIIRILFSNALYWYT